MVGALKTARILAEHGITTRVAVLPLGEEQRAAREKLASMPSGSAEADDLEAAAKIDVNEFFTASHTAADFETILASAQTPLELAISKLSPDIPDSDLSRLLEPILAEVGRLDPIEQERHLRLIQARCGKVRMPVTTLRKQLKVVEIARPRRQPHGGSGGGMRGAAATAPAGEPDTEPLRSIQVNNRQLRDIIADAWAAVHAINEPGEPGSPDRPFLFQKGGTLMRIGGDGANARIEPLGETAVYGMLARSANWHKVTEEAVVAALPSKETARDMLVNPDFRVPPLESLIRTPTFGCKGAVITTPGYHRDDALWLYADPSLEIPEIPPHPSREQIARARALLLDELLVDFPFVRDSDRAHAVAAILLPFMERMIEGLAPIHLIEAPTQGSGKGLLASLIGIVTTGSAPEGRTLPEDEDDVRKMITAELVTGRPIVLIDNLNEKRTLDSSSVASVVTQPTWTDRILGVTRMLSLENHALWLMTGNNPQLSSEMTRRCIRLRIDPRIDMPWLRDGFKHPIVADWARENRSALVHAALTLIQAWIAADKPLHRRRLGSFEKWSEVMGGVLEVAEIPGFLGDLNELYAAADGDGQAWREFTGAWWEEYRDEPKRINDLNQFCEDRDLMLAVRGDASARSQQTRLGKALGVKRDRVFNGLTITRLDKGKHKGSTLWALVPVDGNKPGGCSRNLSLLESLDGDVHSCDGDVGDILGTLPDQRPQALGPIESMSSEQFGDVGDVGDVSRESRARETHTVCPDINTEETARENSVEHPAQTGENVPNVPIAPVTHTKEGRLSLGTFGRQRPHDVPTTSPCGKLASVVDLAKLPAGPDSRGKDPP
jgi:hypothetical protein